MSHMTLSREVVVPGIVAEYERFGQLIRSMSDSDWQQPTRCEGWTVADVSAHVVGTLTEVANFRLEGLGTPERTQGTVDERRGRTPAEVADELDASVKLARDVLAGFDDAAWAAPAGAGLPGTIGFGVETLWYDTFVHADDIRKATGRPSERVEGDGLEAAVSHITTVLDEQGYPTADLDLDALDPFEFVLVATGRQDPATLRLDETVNIYR